MGVVVRRYVYRYPQNNKKIFPTPLILALFLAAESLLLCSCFKCLFVLVYVIFVHYIANVTQRTFEIIQKIEITQI